MYMYIGRYTCTYMLQYATDMYAVYMYNVQCTMYMHRGMCV